MWAAYGAGHMGPQEPGASTGPRSGGRYSHHESIHVRGIDTEDARAAAVGREQPGGDATAKGADAEAGAFGGLGEGLELAAGAGGVGHG